MHVTLLADQPGIGPTIHVSFQESKVFLSVVNCSNNSQENTGALIKEWPQVEDRDLLTETLCDVSTRSLSFHSPDGRRFKLLLKEAGKSWSGIITDVFPLRTGTPAIMADSGWKRSWFSVGHRNVPLWSRVSAVCNVCRKKRRRLCFRKGLCRAHARTQTHTLYNGQADLVEAATSLLCEI